MKFTFLLGAILLHQVAFGQKKVSITIDDVPNTSLVAKGFKSVLLEKLDSLNLPIAIFINEGLLYKSDSFSRNSDLLNYWIQREYITVGNHSFSHSRYSSTGFEEFAKDITRGDSISKVIVEKYGKTVKHFRFPYNDLGQDSLQHMQIRRFLTEKGYVIAPFTIESMDWMFNFVYQYYLDQNELERASEIGHKYVLKTLEYFDFFEALAEQEHNRPINQIYLCHDNKLNADFLPILMNELNKRDYEFVSLEEALTDPIYTQNDSYFLKWGISWMYRWIPTQKERFEKMNHEPDSESISTLYEGILKEKSN